MGKFSIYWGETGIKKIKEYIFREKGRIFLEIQLKLYRKLDYWARAKEEENVKICVDEANKLYSQY